MKSSFLSNAYLRGEILPFEKANISIATHALHYGTAAFAGMRVQADKKKPGRVLLFRPELHIKRLSDSAKLLGYRLSQDEINGAIKKFINANPGDKPYYMRPLVYVSDLGIAPRLHDVEYDFLIYGLQMGEYLSKDGITCCFSSWMRGEDWSLPLRGKLSGAYASSALAKTEAVNRGFDEAIMLNTRGKVAEASAMNIFMVKDGTLITPPVTEDILEGITRRSILELAEDLGIPTLERPIDKSELILAEEAFLTGTAAQITPITRIEQYDLPKTNSITQKIMQTFDEIVAQKPDLYQEWLQSFVARS